MGWTTPTPAPPIMRTDIAPGFSPTFDAAQRLSATCCTRCRRQRSFSGSLPERLAQIGDEKGIEPAAIEIWFADEARVGQKNKITGRWAKRGTRPTAPKDQRTASAYIFGAICPKDGKGAALVMPRCDTEAMNLHLAEIATQIAPGAHAALLVDQAGWHLSGPAHRAFQHHADPVSGKVPRAEPAGKRLAVHARKLALKSDLQILRRHRRPLLRDLEQARRSTLADHVHRNARLGLQVLIRESWYNA